MTHPAVSPHNKTDQYASQPLQHHRPAVSYLYSPLLGLPTFAVHVLYKHQHATAHSELHRTSRLQHAALGRLLSCSSPLLPYYCTYFLSSILHLARATAVYIYKILKLQLSWHFPLPGHRNFVLVHHSVLVHQSHVPLLSCTTNLVYHSVLVHVSCITPYSCTNLVHLSYLCTSRASLCTCAPISCTSTLVHQSCAPPISCTTRTCAHSRRHSETCRCPFKYTHAHSVCPLCAHSRRHSDDCRGNAT